MAPQSAFRCVPVLSAVHPKSDQARPRRRRRRPAFASLTVCCALVATPILPSLRENCTEVVTLQAESFRRRRGTSVLAAVGVKARERHLQAAVVGRDPFRDPFVNTKRPLITYHVGRDAEREMLWRMCVAIACGSIIGMERRAASASAGVRTLALVSLGAAVFTLTALLSVNGNSSRMGAAVSTGIGFLGAGAIHHESTQRHLVTAASVWIAASLGVAAASGLKFLSLIAALVTVGILRWGVFTRYMRIVWKRNFPTFILHIQSLCGFKKMP